MIVFLTELDAAMTARVTPLLGAHRVVRNLAELRQAEGTGLFSFSTSIIVPSDVLRRFDGAAYNLHAASPEYPGRDPHHWAVYDGATRYGATLHQMTPRVDDGPIIDVEWFDVEAGTMPPQLLAAANAAALRLLARVAPQLQRSGAPIFWLCAACRLIFWRRNLPTGCALLTVQIMITCRSRCMGGLSALNAPE